MKTKEYNFENARRGAVIKNLANKTRITIRVDTDILNWFRDKVHQAGGGNYQTLINEALREHIQQRNGALEVTLRKVLREELQIGLLKAPVERKIAAKHTVVA
jgi:predicted DNA binding CopG/RHH family protein